MIESILLYPSWMILFGTVLFGDSIVLAASAMAATGRWSVWAVLIWAAQPEMVFRDFQQALRVGME